MEEVCFVHDGTGQDVTRRVVWESCMGAEAGTGGSQAKILEADHTSE